MYFPTKLCKLKPPELCCLSKSSLLNISLEAWALLIKIQEDQSVWCTGSSGSPMPNRHGLKRRDLWSCDLLIREFGGAVCPTRLWVTVSHNLSLHRGKKTWEASCWCFLSFCTCVVPDLNAHTLQGQFLPLSITSVNTVNGVLTGYNLIFFRHIHKQNGIFLIPALSVFTQQGG